jgi:PAS domain S-box-containing protein
MNETKTNTLTEPARWGSMTARMIALNAVLVIFTAVTVSTVLHYVNSHERVSELGRELEHMAAAGVLLLDAEAHARIQDSQDSAGEDFTRVKEQLEQLRRAYGLDADAVYTLRPSEQGGTRFVAMLGTPYTGDPYALRPEMRRAIEERRPTHTRDVYQDDYGQWLSAYAPIITPDGRVDGLLEVDYKADKVLTLKSDIRNQTALYTLLCVLLAVGLSALAMRWLLGPLGTLAHAIGALRQGDYEHRIDTSSTASELETIANTFNDMVEAIAQRDRVLSASERRYRTLFSSVGETILVVNRHCGGVMDINEAGEQLLGRPRDQILGKNLAELMQQGGPHSPRATNLRQLEDLMSQPEDTDRERTCTLVRHTECSGVRFHELHASPLEVDQKCAWLVTCRDITQRREEWAALLQASKLAAIGEMASGLAHQINNPLVGVLNFAQLLRRRLPEGDPNEALAATIEQSAERCRDVVRALLRFGRTEPESERQDIDITKVIDEAVILSNGYLRKHNAQIQVELPEGTPPGVGSRTQLTQVLLNLINNAVQAAGEDAQVHIRASWGHELVHIDISDNGPGIPEDIRDRIFEPFFTTKEEGDGTGLGLSVAYGIVQRHKGHLALRPSEQGATFRLCLPTVHAPQDMHMICSEEPSHA